MATVYSVQQTNKNALAAGTGYSLNDGFNTTGARVHTMYANYVTTAIASSTVIEMFTLPKGVRILSGKLITGAMGASVTSAVGTDVATVDDLGAVTTAAGSANFLAATSTAAASNTGICQTQLLGAGSLTTAATTVNITTGGATATAGISVQLWIDYLGNA